MTSSSWRVSGQTSTHQYSASSSNNLGDAINSKMNILLHSLICLTTVFFAFPTISIAWSILHTHCAWKPLQSTSTGNSHAFQPLSLDVVNSSVFFSFFRWYASSHLSFHMTVSSIVTIIFDDCDKTTMYRRRVYVLILETQVSYQCQPSCSIHCPRPRWSAYISLSDEPGLLCLFLMVSSFFSQYQGSLSDVLRTLSCRHVSISSLYQNNLAA